MLPSPADFSTVMSSMGVHSDNHVVVYDGSDEGIFSSARLWWMLRVFGHKHVSVLDGGLNEWVNQNNDLETIEVSDSIDGNGINTDFNATMPAPALLIPHADMKANISEAASAQFQIIDARGRARFDGTTPESRPGLRGGHMPHAISIPFTSVLNPETKKMKAPDELDSVFATAGIDGLKPIVASCGSGVTACVLALAMEHSNLDAAPITVYDGSWTQWASDLECPVVLTQTPE